MFCSECGNQLPEGTKFCTTCGQQIGIPVAPPVAPPVAYPPPPIAPVSPYAYAPQAQKKSSKKWWIIGVVVVLVVLAPIFILFLIGFIHGVRQGLTRGSTQGYQLNTQELAIFDAVFQEDAKDFVTGHKSTLRGDMMLVSPQEITDAYEESRVAGDQKYDQKEMNLLGNVAKINLNKGNDPYIVFQGSNKLMQVQAHFDSGLQDRKITSSQVSSDEVLKRIAGLKEGQQISLVCNGGGLNVGTPVLQNCMFADTYAEAAAAKLKDTLIREAAGKEVASADDMKEVITLIFMVRELPKDSACYTMSKSAECLKDMAAYNAKLDASRSGTRQKCLQIAKELQSKGVVMPKELIDELSGGR